MNSFCQISMLEAYNVYLVQHPPANTGDIFVDQNGKSNAKKFIVLQ